MTTDRLGLYVHIPYCVKKCDYCDFCSLPIGRARIDDRYILALCEDILSYKREERLSLDTVFFGGGTPSLLAPDQLGAIVRAIKESFDISGRGEWTFEANPGTVTEEALRAFRLAGFNRVSMGLQSIHENELKILGRIHNFEDFKSSFSILRSAGFDNINVDLMYAIPEQTKESLLATLNTVTALEPEHISAYGLIIEESTPFGKRGSEYEVDPDTESDLYELVYTLLRDSGYHHYEISNYARAGYECRHNLIYWQMKEYIGVGAAAHSFFEKKRFFNSSNVGEYIASPHPVEYEEQSESELAEDHFMLGMRLRDGISRSEYISRYGFDIIKRVKEEELLKMKSEGYLEYDGDRISLTDKGLYVSNSFLLHFLF